LTLRVGRHTARAPVTALDTAVAAARARLEAATR
jgi:hypothetical protein